ncbi:MAG: hypothetical protein WAM79_13345 [Candidatus Sulfotelmatobacter sp.]
MLRRSILRYATRAPRVNLDGMVSVSFQLENGRQLTGKLRTLSVTGGLLDVALYLDERVRISMVFRFGSEILQTKAQLLFPMRGGMGYLQPFRFTEIGTNERRIMQDEIAVRIKQAAAEKPAHRLGAHPPQSLFESF